MASVNIPDRTQAQNDSLRGGLAVETAPSYPATQNFTGREHGR
jgi:hypothetical protein